MKNILFICGILITLSIFSCTPKVIMKSMAIDVASVKKTLNDPSSDIKTFYFHCEYQTKTATRGRIILSLSAINTTDDQIGIAKLFNLYTIHKSGTPYNKNRSFPFYKISRTEMASIVNDPDLTSPTLILKPELNISDNLIYYNIYPSESSIRSGTKVFELASTVIVALKPCPPAKPNFQNQ